MKKPLALALSVFFLSVHAPPTFAATKYIVKKGDTMSEIAEKFNTPLSTLAQNNLQIKDIDLIYPGQVVNIVKEKPIAHQSIIHKPVIHKSVVERETINITPYEKDLLARLVRAEAETEPFSGKVEVALVVLNRVDSKQFPDTIEGVIYQPGQFTTVENGEINKPADAESKQAVEKALSIDRSNKDDGSLYFYNPKITSDDWLESKETTKVIGNHVFKK
jgi:N-acetylmuramoyl-L-alanine amidase